MRHFSNFKYSTSIFNTFWSTLCIPPYQLGTKSDIRQMAETPVLGYTFKHESLDQTRPGIRVFQILPGTGTIRCLMKQVGLDSERTACSYVWGDSEPSHVILINEGLFRVRQNLHDFLLQMRKDNFLEPLWVDALCIDQSNTLERNNQMHEQWSRGWVKVTLRLPNLCNSPEASQKRLQRKEQVVSALLRALTLESSSIYQCIAIVGSSLSSSNRR